ncbi:hypothetical protein TcasGA2_TC002316 [Tribolium castaneum]|uniref:Uncharacterized protein n=1 Tax=Tribolium castaneum TaxID=7070 RepID=D7EHV6_TRICA|nr:hypothetical protein TcasGA2_TC002316 [Tribolium castaneum]
MDVCIIIVNRNNYFKKLSLLRIALQEMHLRPEQPYQLKNYNIIRIDVEPKVRSRSGVAIITRQDVVYTVVPLNTAITAVAIRISTPLQIVICNMYLPDDDWRKHSVSITNSIFAARRGYHRDMRGRFVEQLQENPEIRL